MSELLFKNKFKLFLKYQIYFLIISSLLNFVDSEISLLLLPLISIPIMIYFYKSQQILSLKELFALKKISNSQLIKAILLAILIQPIFITMGRINFYLFNTNNIHILFNWRSLMFYTLGYVLLPSIIEELSFRGFFYKIYENRKNIYFRIFISAFIFAIMHNSLQNFVYPFLLGLLLAFVRDKDESVISSIVLHMTYNLMILIKLFNYDKINSFASSNIVLMIALSLLSLIVIIVLLKTYYKKENNKNVLEIKIRDKHERKKEYLFDTEVKRGYKYLYISISIYLLINLPILIQLFR